MKTANIGGKLVQILRSRKQGGKFVAVKVRQLQKLKVNDEETDQYLGTKLVPFGQVYESFGGFKRTKDFDYRIAELMALENAVAKIK